MMTLSSLSSSTPLQRASLFPDAFPSYQQGMEVIAQKCAWTRPTILMCPPTFFEVSYVINPWMETGVPVNQAKAQQQWETLVATLETKAGANVVTMPAAPGLPDIVFTANHAFMWGNKALVARYKNPERQPETPLAKTWFEAHGYEVIETPEEVAFEGAGDALIWRNELVFAGYRARSHFQAHLDIAHVCGLPVLPLELKNPRFYHIDVCCCPMETGHFVYAPEAFDEYGRQVIEYHIPERLRIPVAIEEAHNFACNAISVGDSLVFNQGSPRLAAALREKGIQALEVDVSEFLKAGGSTKCLSLRVFTP
ncbi:MAG: dimethylarginine dimethylaminohydrolase family protein [Vampirovibrionales bacterium]